MLRAYIITLNRDGGTLQANGVFGVEFNSQETQDLLCGWIARVGYDGTAVDRSCVARARSRRRTGPSRASGARSTTCGWQRGQATRQALRISFASRHCRNGSNANEDSDDGGEFHDAL